MRHVVNSGFSILFLTLLSGCTDDFMSSKVKDQRKSASQVTSVVDSEGNYSAAIDPLSSSTQVMRVTSGSVAGAAIAMPPGSLSIPITVTIGEATALASAATLQQLGLGSNSVSAGGPSVSFLPSTASVASSPFTLSIPFSTNSSLALDNASTKSENIIVMYKSILVENGVTGYAVGIIPRSEITIGPNSVQFQTNAFGSFQIAYTQTAVTQKVEKISTKAPALKSNVLPLQSVNYASASLAYTVGVVIAPSIPVITGGTADSYKIEPTLPAGLTFDTVTGAIAGTPTLASSDVEFTVTAQNDKNTVSTKLKIKVESPFLDLAPIAGSFSASTAVTSNGFALNWTPASDATTPVANLQYLVCSGTSSALIATIADCESQTIEMAYSSAVVALTISGKSPSATYYYNVIVKDSSGNKTIYAGLTQATAGDGTPPTAGMFSASSSVGLTGFTLNWAASSDDVTMAGNLQYLLCTGASAVDIDTVAECEAATIVTGFTTNILSYTVSSLTPSTTYYYNVVVKDAAGNKSLYNGKTQSTTADNVNPTVGSPTATTGLGLTSLTLNWSQATDNATSTPGLFYYVCQGASLMAIDTVAECEAATQIMNWTVNALTKNITGLNEDTSYYFNVLVKDVSGNKAIYSGWTVKTLSSTATTSSNASRSGAVRHTFFDTVYSQHWEIYQDGSVLKTRYSADAAGWSSGSTLTFPGKSFTLHYKVISGIGYVFLVYADSFDIHLVRGTVSATSIAFGASQIVFDGTSADNQFSNPAVATDDNHLWVAASRFTGTWWETVAKETTSAPDASLTWAASTKFGGPSTNPRDVALLPRSGGTMFALYQDGSSVAAYQCVSGTWSAASSGGEKAWFSLLSQNGLNGPVYSLVINGGDVYAGGEFTDAGGNMAADYVAKWNGTSWSALGSGVDAMVTAMVFLGPDLYVGGEFTTAGGNANANKIAKWNGSSWSAVGGGLDAGVTAFAVSGSDLFVGGYFTSAGSVTNADRVAKWDGSNWSALSSGISNGNVSALAVVGSNIYVGGSFTDAGGNTSADNIAVWDGITLSAIGAGGSSTIGPINALAYNGTNLYAGGGFTNAGGNATANYIAKLSSGAWMSLGASPPNGAVFALAVSGANVYVGGVFSSAGGNTSADAIAKWDGTSNWYSLGSGMLGGTVFAIATSGSDTFVGGDFTSVNGSLKSPKIARWNGSWAKLNSGLSGAINAVAVIGTRIYVGGLFTDFGGDPDADYILQWDGTAWGPLGIYSPNGAVRALVADGTNLYVGGEFTSINSVPYNRVAKWDQTLSSWSTLGGGLTSAVHTLTMYGSNLVAGGAFTSGISVFSSGSWSVLGGGVSGTVYALGVSSTGTDLYAGGSFTDAGGNTSADRFAKWDNTSWTSLGSGITSGSVNAIAVYGSTVYVGGNFASPSADNIAAWNGSSWSALGSGVSGEVFGLAVSSGGDLYAAGNFADADANPLNAYLSRWDGSSWLRVKGSSLQGPAYRVFAGGSDIYVSAAHVLGVVSAGAVAGDVASFSAVVNSSSEPAILYTNWDGNVIFKKYSASVWLNESTVDASPGLSTPVLSGVAGQDALYAIYFAGDGSLIYKGYASSVWSGSTTTLFGSALKVRSPTCNAVSGGGKIVCIGTSGSATPFTVNTGSFSP